MNSAILCLLIALPAAIAGEPRIPNGLIDYGSYLRIARETLPVRERRRLTEA